MGLESWFSKKPKEEKMDTPEQRDADRKDRRAIAGTVAAGVAAAGITAMAHEGLANLDKTPESSASAKIDINPDHLKPQSLDARGTTVELKDGQAIVNIAPHEDAPPTNIDLTSKPVDIHLK